MTSWTNCNACSNPILSCRCGGYGNLPKISLPAPGRTTMSTAYLQIYINPETGRCWTQITSEPNPTMIGTLTGGASPFCVDALSAKSYDAAHEGLLEKMRTDHKLQPLLRILKGEDL